MINILFLGDIVGRPGREIVKSLLPGLKAKYSIDFVIANGENATHGKGLSLKHYTELMEAGVNAVTMGNHFFRCDEIINKNDKYLNMVRPYNLNPVVPGVGTKVFKVKSSLIRVTNLLGRVFIDGADSNPFTDLEKIISKEEKADIHIVDFHAEATGEKMALAKAFDGKISALVGTHTHVQTNDNRILPLGTGFLSDAGMCGLYDSILGVLPENVIKHTSLGIPTRFEVPESGPSQLNGVVININERTGKTEKICLVNEHNF